MGQQSKVLRPLTTLFLSLSKKNMAQELVRVRFAPSPTGPLHIGGLRTALFNYLFAKKYRGSFILRIEDTDRTRYVEGAEDYILESLKWCGIEPDEGVGKGGKYAPYRQSERKELYRKYAESLVLSGYAYYAFDTAEELDKLRADYESRKETFRYDASVRNSLNNSLKLSDKEVKEKLEAGEPYVIRFKFNDEQEIVMHDEIRGRVEVLSSTLDDKVLFKSDGMPTYHLANVVDDYLMKITHVIRGEEWLPSLPLHVSLYRALGWEDDMPRFAHLPLILKPTGKGKLSKRDGDKGGFPVFPVEWKDPSSGEISAGYRETGYFPEACVNILALLGWNPGSEKELFSMDELIENFDLDRVGKAGAKFDPDKARWFNHQYLQSRDINEVSRKFDEILREKNIKADPEKVQKICSLVRERADFIHEIWDQADFFFEPPSVYDPKVVKKRWKENTPELMTALAKVIDECEAFNAQALEKAVKGWIEKEELGMGAVMNAWRLTLVGASRGPGLFDISEIIGKKETISRIHKAIEVLKG